MTWVPISDDPTWKSTYEANARCSGIVSIRQVEKSFEEVTIGEPEVRTSVMPISFVTFSIAFRCTSAAMTS